MNNKQIKILEEMRDNCREQLKVENSQKGMQYYLALSRAVSELKQNNKKLLKGFLLGFNAGLFFILISIIIWGFLK